MGCKSWSIRRRPGAPALDFQTWESTNPIHRYQPPRLDKSRDYLSMPSQPATLFLYVQS